MELRPGERVTHNIELLQALGAGGMGAVWVARHHGLGVDVAVKFLSAELVEDDSMLQRFTREARAAAQIRSPHVVSVFDHGVKDSYPYIVMELLEGEDLGARIARLGPLPPKEIANILTQMGKALERAHARSIVHRDIKPSNVFITDPEGELFVKLLDFGIAKRIERDERDVTASGVLMGTAYYMSPEQVLDPRNIDTRSDLWSSAVLAYEALTGSLPFQGNSVGAVLIAIHRGEFEPPYARYGYGSPELDVWFARALSTEPAKRFADARSMVSEFRRAIERTAPQFGATVPAHSSVRPFDATAPAATVNVSESRGRQGLIVVSALGLSALGLGVGGFFVWGERSSEPDVAGTALSTAPSLADAVTPSLAEQLAASGEDAGTKPSRGERIDTELSPAREVASSTSTALPGSEAREVIAAPPRVVIPPSERGQRAPNSLSDAPRAPQRSAPTGAHGNPPPKDPAPKDYGF